MDENSTQCDSIVPIQVTCPVVPLKGQFHLDNVVKIYVPSTYNIDQPIDNSKYVDQSLEKFSNMFGGATSYDGTGAWIGDNEKLVNEELTWNTPVSVFVWIGLVSMIVILSTALKRNGVKEVVSDSRNI
ncbi:hypothetical protein [Peribacillus simplex]|uniref:hypothetical protein n=1 Tax=Peribacillus simplex TaxID=1478 RepID=UPI003BA310BF